MIKTLILSALSLFAAVTTTYMFAWYPTQNIPYARTVAFVTWMFGHIFLAFNMRSDHKPISKERLLSNKVMLAWAFLAVAVLSLSVIVPFIQSSLQITNLNLQSWVLAILVAFLSTFWMEIKKILGR